MMRRLYQRLARIRWRRWIASAAALVALIVAGFFLLVRTEWFKAKVFERFVSQAETATGGRVDVAEYDLDPFGLRVTMKGVTVRAPQPDDAPPFLSIPRLQLELGISSLLHRQVYLRSMQIDSPEVRVEVAEDGSNNLPPFGPESLTAKSAMGELLDLAAGRLNVNNGSIHWNGLQYPVSFASTDFHLRTLYEPGLSRYRAWIRLGESEIAVDGQQPLLSEAEAEFFIYRDRVEAPEVYLAGKDFQVFGRVDAKEFRQPVVSMSYQIKAALPSWASWLGVPFVAAGAAEISGELAWNSADRAVNYRGRLELSEVAIEGGQIAVSQVRASAGFAGDRGELAIDNLAVRALGGVFSGEARIDNLSSPQTRRFQIAGDFDQVTSDSLLLAREAAGSTPARLPWKSVLHGWLKAEGSGTDDLQAALSLILNRPSVLESGEIPLEGVIDVSYDGATQTITLPRTDLATPHSKVEASGTVSSDARAALSLQADLEGPDDLFSLMRMLGRDPAEVPVTLKGRARFDGNLSGNPLSSPPTFALQGRLRVDDFQVRGYDWTSFQGEIEFRPALFELRDGRIQGEAAEAHLRLAVELQNGKPAPQGEVQGEVQFRKLPLARLLEAAGRKEPLTGIAQGRLLVHGAVSEPAGSGSLEVVQGTAWGEPFERLRAEVRFDSEKHVLQSLDLVQGQARLQLTGELDRADQRFRFQTRGTGWRLQDLEILARHEPRPGGDVAFELKGSGRLLQGDDLFDETAFSGSVKLLNLTLGDQKAGSIEARVATDRGRVDVDWRGDLLAAEIAGEARILPSAGAPFSGECRLTKLDVAQAARLADFELRDVSGDMDVGFTFSGMIAQPETFAATGEVSRLQVVYSEVVGAERGYELWNPFPMRWSFSNRTIELDQMRLLGDNTDLEISGTVGFQEDGNPMDVSVAGTFSLAVLESFTADLRASGSSTLQVTVRGTTEDPQVRGRMEVADGSLRHADLPNGLSQMSGELRFDDRRISIEELTATSGGGDLRLSGTAELTAGDWNYRLVADADRVRVRYPRDVSATVDGTFTFSGTNLQSLLSGDVVVNRVSISPRLELGYVIAALGEPTRTPPSNPALVNMQLNVRVSSVPDLLIETSLVRNVEANFDLRLAGTAVNPSLLGQISITRGELEFTGTRYEINRGDISFVNPFRIDPVIDFELETRIGRVDLAMTLSGPARKPNLSYRSDPPLQWHDLVSLIATGRSPTTDPVLAAQQRIEQQSLIQTGANAVLSQALSQPVNRGLQRFFGVSRLKVDPRIGGAEANPSARISTEQYITNDLRLTYSYDLSSAQQQVVEVEWSPARRWSLIVTRDENGLVGADLLFRKRLR